MPNVTSQSFFIATKFVSNLSLRKVLHINVVRIFCYSHSLCGSISESDSFPAAQGFFLSLDINFAFYLCDTALPCLRAHLPIYHHLIFPTKC